LISALTSNLGPLGNALGACRRHFVAAAGFSALLNVLFIAPTLYMLQIYNRVVPTQGKLTLLFLTLVVLFALATLALLDLLRSRLLVRASVQLDAKLAGAILESSLAHSDKDISKQALRDFDTLRQTLAGPGTLAAFDAPWTPIYILVCFIVHPGLGVLALFGAGALLIIAWRNERATRPSLQRANQIAGQTHVSQEYSIASADVVRALGMRRAIAMRHRRQRQAMLDLQTTASFTGVGYLSSSKFARLALQSLALGLGALLAINNEISVGAIFAASFLISRALAPTEQVLGAWKSIVQARGAWGQLVELLKDNPERSVTRLPAPRGSVLVEKLCVSNPAGGRQIIENISFSVAAGETIGIIGPSGAGKSTLARIIAGAATPDQGAVRFDGADQRDWDPEELARHIGYLPQEASLFAGTVKENICRFRTEFDEDPALIDAAVMDASARAGAHDMILRLPSGYDYRLGLGGRGLSAGQAQRVALARAVFGLPKMLVLDEPNAHLDGEGDIQLIRALGSLKEEGVTIFVVAHRLSVLPVIDSLLVMNAGRIEFFGPRDDVMRKIGHSKAPRAVPQAAAE
jgi:ATP-binding cassette, subfamily C, bacterial exporter for protease/lipase